MKKIIAIVIAASLVLTGCFDDNKNKKQLSEEECVKRLQAVCEDYGYELEKHETKMFTCYETVNGNTDLQVHIKINDDNERIMGVFIREYGNKGEISFDLKFMCDLFNSVAEYPVNTKEMEIAISKLRDKVESPYNQYSSEQRKIHGNDIMLGIIDKDQYIEDLTLCGEVAYLD